MSTPHIPQSAYIRGHCPGVHVCAAEHIRDPHHAHWIDHMQAIRTLQLPSPPFLFFANSSSCCFSSSVLMYKSWLSRCKREGRHHAARLDALDFPHFSDLVRVTKTQILSSGVRTGISAPISSDYAHR